MQYLQDFLLERKHYESKAEIEKLLQEKEIDKGSIIQELSFDSEVFPSEDDIRTWLAEYYFEDFVLEGNSATLFDDKQFLDLVEIEIVTGVKAMVGVLLVDQISTIEDYYLSEDKDSKSYKLGRKLSDKVIKLNADLPHIIELATVVDGYHAAYGEVKISPEMLQNFVKNFNDGVVGVDLMIDYDHDQSRAAGWIKGVFLSVDGQTLLGEVKWTPKGAQTLSDRDFRYFSPEFTNNYVHPHTGKVHGPTLLGGGLVNRPFLKMDAIVSCKEGKTTSDLGGQMDSIAMSEHTKVVAQKEKEVAELQLSVQKNEQMIGSQKETITKLNEKVKTLETEKAEKERLSDYQKMFDDGVINAAQLSAAKEGKNDREILSLSTKLNSTPVGEDQDENAVQLSDDDKAMANKFGLTDEEFIKANK